MYKVTYEIEMHVNAILSLDKIISDMGLRSDQTLDMIFYHNELLLRTASIKIILSILVTKCIGWIYLTRINEIEEV